jgi:hypothetical protein
MTAMPRIHAVALPFRQQELHRTKGLTIYSENSHIVVDLGTIPMTYDTKLPTALYKKRIR